MTRLAGEKKPHVESASLRVKERGEEREKKGGGNKKTEKPQPKMPRSPGIVLEGVVEVKPSLLPGGEMGLFAKCTIPKNSFFTRYAGHLITVEEARKLRAEGKGSHLKTLSSQHSVIDGKFDASHPAYKNAGLGSFANDPSARLVRIGGKCSWCRQLETKTPSATSTPIFPLPSPCGCSWEWKVWNSERTRCNSKFVTVCKPELLHSQWPPRYLSEAVSTESCWLKALVDIPPGAEIYASYGKGYWKDENRRNQQRKRKELDAPGILTAMKTTQKLRHTRNSLSLV